ncbi:MAG: hypothetical protein KF773_36230 [Deltaproteobacteria bacterium]|nr:hypothetical protein [Deltaproteobacteria bacterium]
MSGTVIISVGGFLAACGGSGTTATATPQTPKPAADQLVISAAGVGPLTAQTPATLNALRERLVGYDVRPVNRTEGLEYVVSKNGETVFFVIPDPDQDGKILNVHVTSAKAVIQAHAWTIGKTLGTADARTCECWGDKPTCYQKGDFVAASFDRSCDEYDPDIRQRLASVPIARLVWSPNAFDGDRGDDNDPNSGP